VRRLGLTVFASSTAACTQQVRAVSWGSVADEVIA